MTYTPTSHNRRRIVVETQISLRGCKQLIADHAQDIIYKTTGLRYRSIERTTKRKIINATIIIIVAVMMFIPGYIEGDESEIVIGLYLGLFILITGLMTFVFGNPNVVTCFAFKSSQNGRTKIMIQQSENDFGEVDISNKEIDAILIAFNTHDPTSTHREIV